MFRLGACLSLSMWVWRKKRLIENVVRRDRNADLEAGPVEARPTEADPHEGEANAQSGERQQSVASASADRATGQPQATQVERTEVSGVVSLKVASRLRKWINVLAFVLFILGNILVFKPLPSESGDPTCYNASPMLWWGVMSVTAVGWAFAAQVVFWALLGMLLGLTRMILRRMGILPPLPQPELARPSRPAPLSKTEVNKLGYVIYLPESAAPTSLPSELNPASPTASATDPTQHNQHDLLAQEKGLNVRHPIVRLEESQATCGICQEDYVAPERGAEGQLELLRQLGCGHVYHAKCIDQWLTKQAGNCPFCNRSVEIMIRQAKEKKREQEA
ncbi:hypothetical protein I317_01523 [Kwoniella heveanensis CBS 569]|nr:hypothetical protein I317_01523 [Kwoniella heveanensis CBS 569]